MKKIILKHGEIVRVDSDNYEELNKYSWCLNSAGYATRRVDTNTSMLMHRYIANTPKSLETDHINGDKLDNRKENLRNVIHSINQLHGRLSKVNTSGTKGVTWDKKNNKWQSQIKINGKNKFLGRWSTKGLAILARKLGELIWIS